MKLLKSHKMFEGKVEYWSHFSIETKTEMKFSTFIPQGAIKGCIIWLSGLTCTEENFITKAGAQKCLARESLMVICPDTSPRGLNLPGEHESYDFGSGAGFYVDAETESYKDNYRMYSYVVNELYVIIANHFGVKNISISGHSMGGHGALVIGLKNPQKFKSVSAFSPIVNPVNSPWGEKAFTGYLGENKALWNEFDACELLKSGQKHPASIMIHQGTKDEFLEKQLQTQNFKVAADSVGQPHSIKMCEDYDHSYFFIATFIDDHILHHSRHLRNQEQK